MFDGRLRVGLRPHASRKAQDAVARNLQVLAESTQRLSGELKSRPQVERTRIAAFRHVLVHDYLGLDMERNWIVPPQDIPEFEKSVEMMLREIVRP